MIAISDGIFLECNRCYEEFFVSYEENDCMWSGCTPTLCDECDKLNNKELEL